VCARVWMNNPPTTLSQHSNQQDASKTNAIKMTRPILASTRSKHPEQEAGNYGCRQRQTPGLGAKRSRNERIRQWSRTSGIVPLNSPRLLIRLRVCRKSGTVPLNSPRLLIRHRIPSSDYTQTKMLSYKRSLQPARHGQPMQCKPPPSRYKIRDNTTSTGDSQEDSIDPPPRGPEDFDQDRMF
jgi:hypothetical protein